MGDRAERRGLLGLYWGSREQSLEQCASLSYETLDALQAAGFDRYYLLGRTRRDALKHAFEVTRENVAALLAKGVNREDVPPRHPIVDLGWSLSLWSGGANDESYSLGLHCGSYSRHVGNSVVLKLPADGPFSLRNARESLLQAYERLLTTWDPDQAVLCEGWIDWEDGVLRTELGPVAIYRHDRFTAR